MGETRVKIRVFGQKGTKDVEAIVDTGATFSKIPIAIAEEIDLEARYETEVELADGRRINRKLSLAEISLEGRRRPVLVALSSNGEHPLVGYTALENLELKVNPVTRRLEKATPNRIFLRWLDV